MDTMDDARIYIFARGFWKTGWIVIYDISKSDYPASKCISNSLNKSILSQNPGYKY